MCISYRSRAGSEMRNTELPRRIGSGAMQWIATITKFYRWSCGDSWDVGSPELNAFEKGSAIRGILKPVIGRTSMNFAEKGISKHVPPINLL